MSSPVRLVSYRQGLLKSRRGSTHEGLRLRHHTSTRPIFLFGSVADCLHTVCCCQLAVLSLLFLTRVRQATGLFFPRAVLPVCHQRSRPCSKGSQKLIRKCILGLQEYTSYHRLSFTPEFGLLELLIIYFVFMQQVSLAACISGLVSALSGYCQYWPSDR